MYLNQQNRRQYCAQHREHMIQCNNSGNRIIFLFHEQTAEKEQNQIVYNSKSHKVQNMIVCDFYTDSLRSSAVSILSTVSESHLNVLLLTRFAITL